jgi:uncharacterized protein (DUF1015 family)
VPHFEPFRGVRYDLSRSPVADVTAPPYDVIDPDDRAALVARHPHNVVVIDLPDEADGPDRYTAAARTFATWQDDGTLLRDDVPTYYAYRMGYRDDLGRPAHTLGVVGALELSRPGEGGILPHERTTPKAKSDRLDLLRATRANLSSVWGLSLTSGLSDLCRTDEAPDAAWTDDDGVEHTLWRITDPDRVAAISTAVASSPVVIADGHHRYETSLAYRDERREAEGTGGGADLVMVYVVELVDDELTVRPIHRLLADLPDGFDLEAALAPFFDVSDGGVADAMVLTRMAEAGALALVRPGGSVALLRPRPEAMAGAADLDSARLDVALAALPAHTLTYQHGVDLVGKAVESGRAQYGVLLRPATVAQIDANAHAGERMPPKTTFFHPKPRTGVVFRLTD